MNSQALKELKGLVAERKLHLDASEELDNSYGETHFSRSEWIEKRDELEDQLTFLNSQIAEFVCENL
jgi:hypothetical protein